MREFFVPSCDETLDEDIPPLKGDSGCEGSREGDVSPEQSKTLSGDSGACLLDWGFSGEFLGGVDMPGCKRSETKAIGAYSRIAQTKTAQCIRAVPTQLGVPLDTFDRTQ